MNDVNLDKAIDLAILLRNECEQELRGLNSDRVMYDRYQSFVFDSNSFINSAIRLREKKEDPKWFSR